LRTLAEVGFEIIYTEVDKPYSFRQQFGWRPVRLLGIVADMACVIKVIEVLLTFWEPGLGAEVIKFEVFLTTCETFLEKTVRASSFEIPPYVRPKCGVTTRDHGDGTRAIETRHISYPLDSYYEPAAGATR
jgi:hypothetical protein